MSPALASSEILEIYQEMSIYKMKLTNQKGLIF